MSTILAIIACPQRVAQGQLAAEALRKVATQIGHQISIEIRNAQGVQGLLDAGRIASADAVVVIAEGDADLARLGGKPAHHATLEAVLADAGAVIGKALGAHEPVTTLRIVAITSCPTGIAHTFMAAEGLTQGAQQLGHQIKVETQGSVGSQNALTASDIADADLVIIAADTQVDLLRFDGKRVFSSGTKAAINDGQALIKRAQVEARAHAANGKAAASAAANVATTSERSSAYKHLMTGVSFMLPFVVTGGLLIALGFALGGIYVYEDAFKGTLGWTLFTIGAKASFALMVPILAGYIAYSIADRPGIAPGMAGGMIASSIGSGFLGGIVAGFIAGYAVKYLNEKIQLGRNFDGLKPVLILPLLGTTIVGLLMYYVLGQPVAVALNIVTEWLKGLQGSSALALGMILGGMMAFDMGGPINKAAYTFSTGLLASQVYAPMAAVMAAGMTPPLGIALAALLFKNRFSADEREGAKAAGVLGISFITEGAIPFAAKDPLRVIPALVAGSALAGAISMAAGCELRVPHGGVFVLPIPNAVTNLGMYLVALAAGTALTAVLLGVLKKARAD
ncbi:PTS system D-fructose-specific IIB component (F1P-forming) (Frc family) /PTS system D-fructose-specific IIC component (F1P-forming) (Frc family) [Vogesella indigofera]|uniref:protein-N(pi)-phosphohistidine--D-fructose phosphotransferase n=1 Tax=Vogesella indigofera TaxID=45465 RepID=A0A495BK47_VOGIN|nr:fructose-specific PTS transporter subunit EIIC [Vogesella indigofera]RKQ61271.1 PTS system D-fructose-specific IIB component (F1P-forming) (Frc family) /PTS system D-fructose-specific IIC component (F1P-forming) (Frc family) [Vogesella indigofera]